MDEFEHLALVRLSTELSTKAQGTRRRFLRRLVQNLRDALASTTNAEFSVESHWGRIYVGLNGSPLDLRVLSRVSGISSYSLILGRSGAEMDEIVSTGRHLFAERVKGRSYAVRARRTGSHEYSSNDILFKLGAALNPGARVNLDDPEVEVCVEVRDDQAYFYSGRFDGMGGLPLAVEGRAICLVSGGFDSAVAAWMMLKRGVRLDYVFCNLAGEAYERSVVQVAKVLADDWSFGYQPVIRVLDFAPVVEELKRTVQPRFWQVILKRLMYRAATTIAGQQKAHALVTGECIGQVSSQTLTNLAAIQQATTLPVFRPLIGYDKMDIVSLARTVGTHDISARVKEYCAIAPGNPVTNARLRETEIEEMKVDAAVLEVAIEGGRTIDLRKLARSDLVVSYVYTDILPETANVIDVRGEGDWEVWHYPGARNVPSWEIEANPRQLDRDLTYVLYCDQGIQSAQAAELMQREGYEAYAYRSGTAGLRRRVEAGRT